MIFARRAIQRRLNELRGSVGSPVVDGIVKRLNTPGKDSLAAMWEVVILHGLAAVGTVRSEVALSTGKRPDISFTSDGISFTADITTVSDEGLEKKNPVRDLADLIGAGTRKLGLPIGGVDIQVKAERVEGPKGRRTELRVPPRGDQPAFVKQRLMPELRRQLRQGQKILKVVIDDETAGIDVTVNPDMSPYSSIGHTSYKVPTTKVANPVYTALEAKAKQLRGSPGVKGIIVADGDTSVLSERHTNWNEVSLGDIAKEFFARHTSMDFVLFLTVREGRQQFWPRINPAQRYLLHMFAVRPDSVHGQKLFQVFEDMKTYCPLPIMMPVNGARVARGDGIPPGHHGGYQVSGNRVRIGSRELIEILAGLSTGDNGEVDVPGADGRSEVPNSFQTHFLRYLRAGRLPSSISVHKTDENGSDDWIEFEFGEADPAISPFA